MCFSSGGAQAVTGYEDPNGFYVTPDGLFIPQQYMYYQEPQFQVGQAAAPPVDVTVLKDLIKKQV